MNESTSGNVLNSSEDALAVMVQEANRVSITLWSDDKKKDFVKVFNDRSKAAQYILVATAMELMNLAEQRKYISSKHRGQVDRLNPHLLYDDLHTYAPSSLVGGRSSSQLVDIARERANAILNELPPVRKATAIILPDIAKKMDQRDKLVAEGKKLLETLEELSEPICMSQCDQSLTIAGFRKLVEKRVDEREAVMKKLNKMGVQGCALDDEINKALFSGLPGLSDAVVAVVKQHGERAEMLDQLSRRVSERVLFGDSTEALDLLARFEKDEVEVSSSIKGEFKKAIASLNLAGAKNKKARTAK